MVEQQKLVIMATHGPEDPERATIPFVMGCAALASDVAVVIGFQADGVCLVHEGEAGTVEAAGLPAAGQAARRLPGARRHAPRLHPVRQEPRHRRMPLIPGTELVAAARFVAEVTSATSTLSY